jgi:phosphoserine aminotransferase
MATPSRFTIFGTQWKTLPTPVNPNGYQVIDDSSDIFSRPIDWSRVGMVYAGAQKNAGPAGVTLLIIREDILGKSGRTIPTMLDYATHIKAESMFNTPPVFSVYVMNETMKWLKALGGIPGMEEINNRKAGKLYAEIDRNPMFQGTAAVEDRSPMNVPFVLNPEKVSAEQKEAKEKEFLAFCKDRDLVTLAGHRVVGGFRASIYNAMPEAGIDALVLAMQDFSKKNGVE